MGAEGAVREIVFSQIGFRVVPSPDTNDHAVLIFIDGRDLIQDHSPDMMGMDPDEILHNRFLAPQVSPFEATVARCTCGVVGCGSATVEISTEGEAVVWDSWDGALAVSNPGRIVFQKTHYLEALTKAVNDHSWETPDRTAARLLETKVDRNFLLSHELEYQWASGRVEDGKFTVSLRGPGSFHQILVHVTWSHERPEEIAEKAAQNLRQHPRQWSEVAWYGGEKSPPFEGPGWKV